MSSPDNNHQPSDKQLREDYRAHGRAHEHDAPSADTDARILAEAHRAIRPRTHPAAWAGLVALAASIGLAVVMVPALLLEPPAREMASAPAADKAPLELQRVEVTGARISAADAENAQREQRQRAEQLLDMAAMKSLETERARAIAQAVENSGPDLAALRAELAGAPEPQWRATLVALRDSDRRELAEQLMPTYKETFDLDDSLTLDMLVAEVTQ